METAKTISSEERTKVVEAIRAFLQSSSPDKAVPLDEKADLVKEWFVDSMTIVSVVAFLEEKFGITVKRADINGKTFRNLGTLTDYVVARMAQAKR